MKKSNQSVSEIIFDFVNFSLLIFFMTAIIYPLIVVVSSSFSNPIAVANGKVLFLPVEPTLEAYVRVFRDKDILIGYRNSIFYTVTGTFLNLFLTSITAYALSKKEFYGKRAVMLFFTFTMFFSGGTIPSYLVVQSLGLINTFWAIILPTALSVYNLIVMKTFLENNIPIELYEAAAIDSCTQTGMLVRIALPLSKPVLAVMVLFYGVGNWNSFFNALMYITDRNKYPLQLVLRAVLLQAFSMEEMVYDYTPAEGLLVAEGLKYAIVIVASVPVLMLYPFLQKYFVKGVIVGAIKG